MADNRNPANMQEPGYFSPLGQRNWLESVVGKKASDTSLNMAKPLAAVQDVLAAPISFPAQFIAGAAGAREAVSATPFYDYTRSAEEQKRPVAPGVVQDLGAKFGDFLALPSNAVRAVGNYLDPQEVGPVQSWTPKSDIIRGLPGYNFEAATPAPRAMTEDRSRKEPMEVTSTPKPAAGPISIVRGLQTTEYLPTMNERGQVQYKAKQTPEQLLAAAQAEAGLKKTLSEVQKNVQGTGMDQAVRTRLAPLQSLQQVIASPNSTKEDVDAARAEINNIWGDIFKLDYLARYGIAGATGQNTGG